MQWIRIPFCLTVALAIVQPDVANGHPDKRCTEVKCFETAQKIRALEQKLRRSHTNNQGRRYKDRLRQLRDWQREFCR